MQNTEHTSEHPAVEATDNSISKSWIDQLDEAVSKTDEPAIWRLMDEQCSNDSAHEALTSMVSRLAYMHHDRTVFCELFMLPVVTMQGCNVIDNAQVWKGVRNQVREALGGWFNDDGRTTLFDDIAPMDWVTTWRPGVLRAHLERLIPGTGKVRAAFTTEQISLPDEAPRLGFVVIGRSTQKGWRELPSSNGLMDKRLKDVIKYCLQIQASTSASHMETAPIVLAPERIQFAITDGISLWLSKLNEAVGIEGWTVMPSLASRDVVKVTLKLRNKQVGLTQFTLRLHQIGTQGLSDVLSLLQQTAPMFDVPVDMHETEYKKPAKSTLDN
ncbi:hypothetical protein [Polaromonas aquatica]|uniref:Uncharacterized protein n=1 Tax=Polaromonas aquatica TaxID=332657 RepID=A0ABW1TV20_9BURK